MTRPEFIQLAKTDLKRQNRQAVLLMGLMSMFALAGGTLVNHVGDEILRLNSPQLWLLMALTVIVLVLAVLGLRITSKNLLRCPHCRKCLGGYAAQVVVGCGCCGFCGERIIDDTE